MLISETRLRLWPKRPVAELRINPDLGSAVVIFIKSDVLYARVIRLDGYVIATWDTPVAAPTQKNVLETVADVVRKHRPEKPCKLSWQVSGALVTLLMIHR